VEITVHYEPNLDEQLRAVRLIDAKRRALRIAVTTAALLIAVATVVIHASPIWTAVCIGAAIGPNAGQPTRQRNSRRGLLRNCVPTPNVFTGEYFPLHGPTWRVHKLWSDFAKKTETPEFFLLYNKPIIPGFSLHRVYIVPEHALDPTDLDIVGRLRASDTALQGH
jgi:hypothetical protein